MHEFKKYKHELILIKINNVDDSKTIQNYLFSKKIFWIGNKDTIFSFNFSNNPTKYIYVILNDSPNMRLNNGHYLLQNSSVDEYFISNYNSDPKIYTIYDFNKIRSIIEHGTMQPSYKPKRIKRTI